MLLSPLSCIHHPCNDFVAFVITHVIPYHAYSLTPLQKGTSLFGQLLSLQARRELTTLLIKTGRVDFNTKDSVSGDDVLQHKAWNLSAACLPLC